MYFILFSQQNFHEKKKSEKLFFYLNFHKLKMHIPKRCMNSLFFYQPTNDKIKIHNFFLENFHQVFSDEILKIWLYFFVYIFFNNTQGEKTQPDKWKCPNWLKSKEKPLVDSVEVSKSKKPL